MDKIRFRGSPAKCATLVRLKLFLPKQGRQMDMKHCSAILIRNSNDKNRDHPVLGRLSRQVTHFGSNVKSGLIIEKKTEYPNLGRCYYVVLHGII